MRAGKGRFRIEDSARRTGSCRLETAELMEHAHQSTSLSQSGGAPSGERGEGCSPACSPVQAVDEQELWEGDEGGERFSPSSIAWAQPRACVSVEKRSPCSPRSPLLLVSMGC